VLDEDAQKVAQDENTMGLRRPAGPGILEDVVIADFSRVLAGPLATMILADLGATVIKVEGPAGDDSRAWRPPAYRDEASYFQAVNRNKNSIVLDLADPADLHTAKRIAARADVFIHNFKPGSIDRFGLDYESVRALVGDSLVYAHITGFGTEPGPDGGAGLPGYDVLVQGMSGFMSMCGEADGDPTRSGVSIFDITTGMMTANGILAALRHRDRTGQGQKIDINLLSSAVFSMINQYQAVATTDFLPTRQGREHATIYPYHALPTADGELIVVAANNGQFSRLCDVLGIPDTAHDPRFDTAEKRNLNRRELEPVLVAALAEDTTAGWFARLRQVGIPCSPVQDVAGGLASVRGLGLDPVQLPEAAPAGVPTIAGPLRFSATPTSYFKEPPALGADGAAVLDWLGSDPGPDKETQ
jgi:crotonobetainyl-CoA:carnitine CoA-transferase CaiB-like acyl-CoA transferase